MVDKLPRKLFLSTAAVFGTLAAFVAGFIAMAAVGLGPCGGDGGSPHAAPASARGGLCSSVVPQLPFPVAPLVVGAAGVVAVRRRRWRVLAAGLVVGAVLIVAPYAAVQSASPQCAPADQLERGCWGY